MCFRLISFFSNREGKGAVAKQLKNTVRFFLILFDSKYHMGVTRERGGEGGPLPQQDFAGGGIFITLEIQISGGGEKSRKRLIPPWGLRKSRYSELF